MSHSDLDTATRPRHGHAMFIDWKARAQRAEAQLAENLATLATARDNVFSIEHTVSKIVRVATMTEFAGVGHITLIRGNDVCSISMHLSNAQEVANFHHAKRVLFTDPV